MNMVSEFLQKNITLKGGIVVKVVVSIVLMDMIKKRIVLNKFFLKNSISFK